MVLDLRRKKEKYILSAVSLLLCLLNNFRSILSFKTNLNYLYTVYPLAANLPDSVCDYQRGFS